MRSRFLTTITLAVALAGGLTACSTTDDSGVPSWLRPAGSGPNSTAPSYPNSVPTPRMTPYPNQTILPPNNPTAPTIPKETPANNYSFDGYKVPHTTNLVLHLDGQAIHPNPTAVQLVNKCFVQFQVTGPTKGSVDMRLATESLLEMRTADLSKQEGTVATIRANESAIATDANGLQAFSDSSRATKLSPPIMTMTRLVETNGYIGTITARVFHDGSSMSITDYCSSGAQYATQKSVYVTGA